MTAYNELFKSVLDRGMIASDNTLLDYLSEEGLIGSEVWMAKNG